MSDATFCYWSVADGDYAHMMAACIRSARQVGVQEDFHIWTDTSIPDAVCHAAGKYEHRNYLFKFDFLLKTIQLPYDYFVFLDADNFFVRHPGNLIRHTLGSPVHVVLESDCSRDTNTRPDWWGCPLDQYVRLMRECGVNSRSVFNTNAGFWIVHRDCAERMVELAMEFWNHCAMQMYSFTEEAPLAYAGHMLMGNPYAHVLEANPDVWASDWTGVYSGRLPDGSPWEFEDYMDEHRFRVNPAIVHAMRSKDVLIKTALAES